MFTLFALIGWAFFGLIVGLIAKALYPAGDGMQGFLSTIIVGVVGSYIGGLINWLLNFGGPFRPAGLILSIVGGVVFCWAWRTYNLGKLIQAQQMQIQALQAEKKE